MDLLTSIANEDEANDAPTSRPSIAYFGHITKDLVDTGVTTSSWNVYAARDGERVCIAGAPDDFNADLCRVLLQWAGLANRRDLDELAPIMTQLIGWVDRVDKFGPRLQEVRAQRGFVRPQVAPAQTSSRPADVSLLADVGPQCPPTSPSLAGSGVPIPPPAPTAPPAADRTESPEPAADDTPTPSGGPDGPPASSGYTAEDREQRLQRLRKRRAEIDTQMKELLGVGPVPKEFENDNADGTGQSRMVFASDIAYRQAVVHFERDAGRFAETKDAGQPGYDVDSFDKPLDNPSRRLVRRIEVKGHGCDWRDDETVEVSDRQFFDALSRKTDQVALADDFDYWLYVVERRNDGKLDVISIKNPAKRAAKFEFRAGTWRALAEDGHAPESLSDWR